MSARKQIFENCRPWWSANRDKIYQVVCESQKMWLNKSPPG